MRLLRWMFSPMGKASRYHQAAAAESGLGGSWDVWGPQAQVLGADLECRQSLQTLLLYVTPDCDEKG